MENDNKKKFLDSGLNIKAEPITLFFILFQFIFVVIVFVCIFNLLDERVGENDEVYNNNKPQMMIEGLSDKIGLEEREEAEIQKKVLEIVKENTSNLNIAEINAEVREESERIQIIGNDNIRYLTFIIDIPDLQQSYRVFFDSQGVIDLDETTFVLCLDDTEEIIYKDFKCKGSDGNFTKNEILSGYLENYDFKDFSLVVLEKDPSRIMINAFREGLTEEEKNNYIKTVKERVESLGISPDIFQYEVVQLENMTYQLDDV